MVAVPLLPVLLVARFFGPGVFLPLVRWWFPAWPEWLQLAIVTGAVVCTAGAVAWSIRPGIRRVLWPMLSAKHRVGFCHQGSTAGDRLIISAPTELQVVADGRTRHVWAAQGGQILSIADFRHPFSAERLAEELQRRCPTWTVQRKLALVPRIPRPRSSD